MYICIYINNDNDNDDNSSILSYTVCYICIQYVYVVSTWTALAAARSDQFSIDGPQTKSL